MNWLSYLWPQTLLRTTSAVNRDIRVNLERGRPKLLVNGCRESGEQIEKLWVYAFAHLPMPPPGRVRSIAVLGVAGGTVIHLLRQRYPEAHITGVDIDQTMIDIGKRYFGLDTVKHAAFVCADAVAFVTDTRKTFDIVVTDIYVGEMLPDFLLNESFQKNVHRLVEGGGTLLVNYEHELGYGRKATELETLLTSLYPAVHTADITSNRFFLARKRG